VGGLTRTQAPEGFSSGQQYPPTFPALQLAGVFRFGRLTASVRTNDAVFARRFNRIFLDCRDADTAPPAAELSVFVPPEGHAVEARIPGHERLDAGVARALLPGVPVAGFGEILQVPRDAAWPLFFAHYFVHHVMALQPDMLFLHGATLAVNGKGLFLGGDKGAGKSTLALALGARGHGVLGDEVAAIRAADLTCLPFRRAVSVREGPQSPTVRAALEAAGVEAERLADGTTRRRVPLSEMFQGAAPGPVALRCAVFLRGFGARAEVEPFEFSAREAAWIGPLFATFAGRGAGAAALDLVRMFSRLRCYRVTIAGGPEDMAARLESITEDQGC